MFLNVGHLLPVFSTTKATFSAQEMKQVMTTMIYHEYLQILSGRLVPDCGQGTDPL